MKRLITIILALIMALFTAPNRSAERPPVTAVETPQTAIITQVKQVPEESEKPSETREQCEVKLAEMIAEKKAEIAEEKAKLKEGAEKGALNGWCAVNKEYLIVRFCQNSIVFLLS